jgi:DNA-binding response OmpR family regulator
METLRPTILFVDGNSLWTRPVRSELRRQGARVLGLTSFEAAGTPEEARAPDVVILLQGHEGAPAEDLEIRLRKRWPETRFVMVAPPFSSASSTVPSRSVVPMDCGRLLGAIRDALPGRLEEPSRRKKNAPLVLCVDDDAFYLEALGRILGRHGYRTASFDHPEAALEALPVIDPELAILDIAMPGMNGLDLAEEIREMTHDRISIVFLTARSSDDDIARGYQCGGTYYLTKPCDPSRVLNIVDYLIGNLDADERRLLEAQL